MDIWGLFRNEASRLINEIGYEGRAEDARPEFGDFTIPTFTLAKKMKMSPVEVAKKIVEEIGNSEYFSSIKQVGPYINFTVNPGTLTKITLDSVLSGEIFQFPARGKIIVEHTSANPTGPLHVGRTRNSIIGDSMARILRRYGYDVEVQYYVNDVGKQVAMLLWSIMNLKIENDKGESGKDRGDYKYVVYYQKAYQELEENPEIEEEVQKIIWKYERGDKKLRAMAQEYVGSVLKGIRKSLENINIHFDRFVWESSFVGESRRIVEKLKDYLGEENGAFYVNLKKLGIEGKDRIYLYRRDGTTLYPLRDIAYHLYKAALAEKNIDVLGEDHKLHFKIIEKLVKLLQPQADLKALFYSFVKLPEGKMSTRKGRVVYLDDLVEEAMIRVEELIKDRKYSREEMEKIKRDVSVGAIRFHILNVQEEKPMTFMWERALNFEGESGPFIQYTHARAASILRKASWEPREYDITAIEHPEEIKLVKIIAKYGESITQAAELLSPNLIAKYAYNLAAQFNQFYRDCPVLKAPREIRNLRLTIVYSFKEVIKDALQLLGINAPNKM